MKTSDVGNWLDLGQMENQSKDLTSKFVASGFYINSKSKAKTLEFSDK